jgi:hypothetical protein
MLIALSIDYLTKPVNIMAFEVYQVCCKLVATDSEVYFFELLRHPTVLVYACISLVLTPSLFFHEK